MKVISYLQTALKKMTMIKILMKKKTHYHIGKTELNKSVCPEYIRLKKKCLSTQNLRENSERHQISFSAKAIMFKNQIYLDKW